MNNFLCELPSLNEALHWFFNEKKNLSFESFRRAISENPSYLVLYCFALLAVVGITLLALRLILPRGKMAGNRPWGAGEGFLGSLTMFGLVYLVVPTVLLMSLSLVLYFCGEEMTSSHISAVVMLLSVTCGFVLLLFFYSRRYPQKGDSGIRGLGFCAHGIIPNLVRGFVLALLAMPLMVFVITTSMIVFPFFGIEPQTQKVVTEIEQETNAIYLALACFTAIVGAAVWEETLFRGLFLQGLKRDFGRFVAVVLSAGVFAAIHGSITVMPAIFVMGLILAYIYEKTDSLWASIGFHATFNAFQIALLLLGRGH